MFGLKKKSLAVEVQQKEVRIIEKPKPKLHIVKKESFEDYEKFAEQLGFKPAQLIEVKLLKFLEQNNIEIFSYEEVFWYMVDKAEKERKFWCWSPLREKDHSKNIEINFSFIDKDGNRIPHGNYQHGRCSVYDKLVPMRVLKRVQQIENEFPISGLSFFVSDYAVPKPDPFIMVTYPRARMIILDVWDEPDF
jgi:hypothetical protein